MQLHNTQNLLQEITKLADHGLFLQAQQFLPQLLANEEVGAQLLAQRLQNHLGASRAAQASLLRMWRKNKANAQLMSAFARYLLERRGPYAAWRFFQEQLLPLDASDDTSAEWHSTHARTYAFLRDFTRAQELSELARRTAPDNLWVHDEWGQICLLLDDLQQAIVVAREILQRDCQFRATIQTLAYLYVATGQDDAALALLQSSAEKMESASIWGQLFSLQFEHEQYAQATASIAAWRRCTPLNEKGGDIWWQARSADIALRLGDNESAKAYAKLVKGPFFERLLSRLEQGDTSAKRVLLPVGFVHQHHMTCAPATLAALSLYWQRPAEHLEIAEEICYDGTSLYNERNWARQQGFVTREFTVDWDVARALLDAGVPFTLATVYTAAGHLQAVIGYDELRGTLLIRDPNARTHAEYDAESLFASHQSSGPRGMLLLPAEEKSRLDGIVLPDRSIWDASFAVSDALERHQRDEAQRIVTQMIEKLPQHRLSITAQRSLAHYDADDAALLKHNEQLLALYPDDLNMKLSKASLLGRVEGRNPQVAYLENVIATHPRDGQALAFYVTVLMSDDRLIHRTEKFLKYALRYAPTNGAAWYELARWEDKHQRSLMAMRCLRVASCLQETNEEAAASYASSAQRVQRSESGQDSGQDRGQDLGGERGQQQHLTIALTHLRQRHEKLGDKSSLPLITLFSQLESLERTEEAFELLKDALARKPNDADLVLFAVDAFLRYGKKTAARLLMERANLSTKQAAWLHAQAKLEREIGNAAKALDLSLQACQKEPINLPYQRLSASLYAQIEGSSRAIDYLQEICRQFSHHLGLHQLLVSWMSDRPFEEVESVLRHLLQFHPSCLWAQRELALNLSNQQRFEEAHQIIGLAMQMSPNDDTNFAVRGGIYTTQGESQLACADFRQALHIYVDNAHALNSWLENCTSLEQRKEALAHVRSELLRQNTTGDALIGYQLLASSTETREGTYQFLQEVLKQRPDLWQAWAVLAMQCMDINDTAQALQLLSEAVQKFPLCPRLYLETARAQALQGDRKCALDSVQAALKISPLWLQALRLQISLMREEGVDPELVLQVLSNALARIPECAELFALRANILIRQQRNVEALESLKSAIFLDASQGWVWQLLNNLALDMQEPGLVEQVARQLTEKKPGDFWSWGRLANAMQDIDQGLQVAERAIALAPRKTSPYEVKLSMLLHYRRYAELQEALKNLPWKGELPISLRVYQIKCDWAIGKRMEARQAMRLVLDEYPNDGVFWQEYAEYCSALNDLPRYIDATENMLRIDSNSATVHGFVADAMTKDKRFETANTHHERAFAIDPTYTFAGYSLFDTALYQRNAPRCKELIDILGKSTESSLLQARIVQYAGLVNDASLAVPAAQKILASAEGYTWSVDVMLEEMEKAGWRAALIEQIKAAMQKGHCAQTALRYLIDCLNTGSLEKTYADVKALFADDTKQLLMFALVSWMTNKGTTYALLKFVKEYRESLHTSFHHWGHVGSCLVDLGMFARAATWLADYQQRENVPAWLLDVYALALRCAGDPKQAHDVSAASIALDPNNADAKVWMAYDATLFDQQEYYERIAAEIATQELSALYKELFDIVYCYHNALRQGYPELALRQYRAKKQQNRESPPPHYAAHMMMAQLTKRLIAKSAWHEKAIFWMKYT